MPSTSLNGSRGAHLLDSANRYAHKLVRRIRDSSVYAKPRTVTDLDECVIYHTMDIPGYGLVEGQWDLRDNLFEYTGAIDFKGKRVLEVGTASGFICFTLEHAGAEMVAYDLNEHLSWDVVPYASIDQDELAAERRQTIRGLNNGFWLAHRAFRSSARLAHGTVYDVPLEIGAVDVSTFCAILLHVRDPFLAIERAARLTRSTILVTDLVNPHRAEAGVPQIEATNAMEFAPNWRNASPTDTWWFLTPQLVQEWLGILGFGDTTVTHHWQKAAWGKHEFFTVVGRRTQGRPVVD